MWWEATTVYKSNDLLSRRATTASVGSRRRCRGTSWRLSLYSAMRVFSSPAQVRARFDSRTDWWLRLLKIIFVNFEDFQRFFCEILWNHFTQKGFIKFFKKFPFTISYSMTFPVPCLWLWNARLSSRNPQPSSRSSCTPRCSSLSACRRSWRWRWCRLER